MRVGSHSSRPNRGSAYQTVEEERQGRTEAVVQHARLIRRLLPPLLNRLSQIPDPRRPLLLKHKLTTLMVTHSMSQAVNLGDRILMMHKGAVAYRFAGADKQRLGVEDLLARFEDLRRRELLDETAAALLEETYV